LEKLGVALLGLDHWYAGEHVGPAVARSDRVRLVAVAHDDTAKAQSLLRGCDADLWTTDYRAALDRPDVQIVVALYSTDRNVAICREAAALGKHIVSVKPMALDLAGADAIVNAVQSAGVHFFSFESQYRLNPHAQQRKRWIDEGRIGQPLRFVHTQHSGLPIAWPGSAGSGWWIDPARVPGGAWIDHAIYGVDMVRWLLGDQPIAVQGICLKQRHTDQPLEDYGLATYTFASGAVAVIEDTWTAERGFGFSRTEVVGSAGSIAEDTNLRGMVALRGNFGFDGALNLEPKREPRSLVVDHLAAVIHGETAPAATVADGRANLAACLAFYEAARSGASKQL
jgi:predicted dehydrogenase